MKYWMVGSLITFLALTLVGCASSPLDLPVQTGKFENKLHLKSKARVLVRATTKSCESVAAVARFEVVPKKGAASSMKTACDGKGLVSQSDFLPVGEYTLRLSLRKHSLKDLSPQVTLELANPDYRSGPDQYAEAAVAVEPGKGAEGSVHYVEGDATDWLRVAGEKKRVFLTFIPPEDSHSVAAVYRQSPASRPVKLQNLQAGKPSSFYLGKDDLLVRVMASNEDGAIAYTVLRRDEDAKKSVSLQVVDAYPVGPGTSLVLLRPNASVKAEDELRISAKTLSGTWKELGACRVNQSTNEAIACELQGAWSERFTEYKAVGTAPVSG